MSHVLITHEVKDYAHWRPGFDEHGRVRQEFGCLSEQVFRDAGNPNRITVLMEWNSFENAEKFISMPALREAMQEGGVIGQPSVTFLNGS